MPKQLKKDRLIKSLIRFHQNNIVRHFATLDSIAMERHNKAIQTLTNLLKCNSSSTPSNQKSSGPGLLL
jgi:hypothetical protein